jgi:Protein of unknown function (DUF2934)
MNNRHAEIRARAYDIWERQGRAGNPEDHWLEAERQFRDEQEGTETSQDRSQATVEEAPPVEAVEALEAATHDSAKSKRPRGSSQG